jgi:opacity protein-like surface antigen
MKVRTLCIAAVISLFAGSAFAQLREGTVEITPFAGYLWGGRFAEGTTAIFPFTVHQEDHFTFGGSVGYNITSLFEVEALYQRTETNFVTGSDSGPLFGGGNRQRVGGLNIDYWMGYATFNFGHGRVVPYFTIGMGAAHLDPDVPGSDATSDTRYTASAGGGVKVFFTPHFGMRFDGKYFGTLLDSDHHHDHDHCCSNGSDWLSNGGVTGGLTFAF